jgi:hypothetical protein
MTALLFSSDSANLALQTDTFRLDPAAAKAVLAEMKKLGRLTPGGYWTAHLSDARKGSRSGRASVVYTGGHATSEFCNVLALASVGLRTTKNVSEIYAA